MKFDRFVHVDSILDKVIRDTEITNFSREDASEWAWECMGKIGVPSMYKDEQCIIQITDYKGVLPADFIEMVNCRTYLDKIPLNLSMYEFFKDYAGYTDTNKTLTDNINTVTMLSEDYNNWESPASTEIGSGLYQGTSGVPVRLKYVYKIDGDYIHVGMQDEAIEIAYKAIPMYNDNTPMIPDDERVKYAIETTIIYKLLQRGWIKGEVTLQMKAEYEKEYLFAIASARNKAIMPTTEDWELLKNRAMAIIKSQRSHEQGFSLYGMKNSSYLDKSI